MSIAGYIDYKRREFCKDIPCPVQLKLDTLEEGSEEYQKVRQTCVDACKFTTFQFHHWLIDKGYLIVRPKK